MWQGGPGTQGRDNAEPQGNAICSNAGVKGSYAWQHSGGASGTEARAFVGQINLDGDGKISGTATESAAGDIIPGLTIVGSLRDCVELYGHSSPKGDWPK